MDIQQVKQLKILVIGDSCEDIYHFNELSICEIEKINFKNFSAVIVSDYDKGFISKENAEHLSQVCFKNNILLFVDSKKNDLSCFSNAIVKINQSEYKNLIKKPINSELVITQGPAGAMWNDKKFKAAKIEIDHLTINENYENLRNANVCGAGDTFLAGLVVHYVLNKKLSLAILFANKCGAIAINNFGTHTITLEEVKKYYDICI